MELLEELQVAEVVMSRVLASENVPVAVICWTEPTVSDGLAGVRAMDTRVEVTFNVVEPQTVPAQAFTVEEPVARAMAVP
jgi:hypothetical protein